MGVEPRELSGSFNSPDLESEIVQVLEACCKEELCNVLLAGEPDDHHSLQLDVLVLAEAKPAIAEALALSPTPMLRLLDSAAVKAQKQLLSKAKDGTRMSVKNLVHVRVQNLPYSLDPFSDLLNPGVGGILCRHLGLLLAFEGTVVRTGSMQMFESQRLFECCKCKHRFIVDAEVELGGTLQLPPVCPSQRERPCKSAVFKHLEEVQLLTNYQELRVQEKMQCLAMGALPKSIVVVVRDDLVDRCCTGDDVEVLGIITQRWHSLRRGERCNVEVIALVNNLRLTNPQKSTLSISPGLGHQFLDFWAAHRDRPMAARNKILASVCPQIQGLVLVKLALTLMLIGGVQRQDHTGMNIRGELHMLLIGDPGTGKSQFLKYAARLSPRSVVTSGKGTSGAGLTATAVKEGGSWSLEAGAMVLADGGLCCIDEFDGIKEADRAVIHEAMEQQTVSIAKAGMVTSLSTRTTVFGVMNPKGNYDPGRSLAANTGLSGPLLSRFDIVLLLMDMKNPKWDERVSSHILLSHQQVTNLGPVILPDGLWSMEMLQKYICWVRTTLQPIMTADAERVLLAYYQFVRQDGRHSASRVTIRMLESLVRIAQAHARLMARDRVIREDAVMAVLVTEASIHPSDGLEFEGSSRLTGALDPEADYQDQEARVLRMLQLQPSLANEHSI